MADIDFNTYKYHHIRHIQLIDIALWDSNLTLSIKFYLNQLLRPYPIPDHGQAYSFNTKGTLTHEYTQDDYDSDEDFYSNDSIHRCVPVSNAMQLNAGNNASNDCDNFDDPITFNKDDPTHSLVVNLSSSHLNADVISILSKGMKFCPTPGEPDLSKSKVDLDSFHLRMKRYLHFNSTAKDEDLYAMANSNNTDNPNDAPFKHPSFKSPSSWVPPPSIPLEHYISHNYSDLLKSKLHAPKRQNITKEERDSIRSLSSNKDIVIKPADKRGAIVILNRSDYISEGMRQLNDHNFYIQTDTDLSEKHHGEISAKLKSMNEDDEIDDSCSSFLSNPNYRTSEFYMLPKIHKRLKDPPGRPIVSGNGCPTERISQFVDFFLKPIVRDTQSYLRDTTHFLKVLGNAPKLTDTTLLVTLDVSSLYTNIPNDLGIEACREMLDYYRPHSKYPTNDSIIELLDMVLTKNNFNFNNLHFLQVGGTAMGTRLAPSYANLFMDLFERRHVYTYSKQPLLYKRYIDDIFLLWTFGPVELQKFIDHLNSRIPSIRFEANISESEINFLDVKVLLSNNTISTTLYTKETDTLSYLDYSSCHPTSCKKAILYSQFLRLRRICSDLDDFTVQSKLLGLSFHKANYPDHIIQDGFNRAYKMDRDSLLNKTNRKSNSKGNDKLYLITDYHPSYRAVLDITSDNWVMLDNSSSTRPLLQVPVVRGFRRPKNLRDLLVCAKLTTPDTGNYQRNAPKRDRCQRLKCNYCSILNKSGRIICPLNQRSYVTRFNISCCSNNLIYCLLCKACSKIYVGQTKRSLRERICEHLTSIRKRKTHLVVGRHYNTGGHQGTPDVTVYILDFVRTPPAAENSRKRREALEQKWIFRLRSLVPGGLNIAD